MLIISLSDVIVSFFINFFMVLVYFFIGYLNFIYNNEEFINEY